MANYLYNGMEMPPLPEWDKEAYPYAFLWYDKGWLLTKAHLYLLSEIVYKTLTESADGYTGGYPYVLVTRELHASSTLSSGVWSAWTDFAEYPNYETGVLSLFNAGYADEKKWANFDILNEDGTVAVAASYPIDAETGEEIHDYEIGGTAPTIPEGDFYKVVNRQWVKCDSVRLMGNKWVKQDEYLYIKTAEEDEPEIVPYPVAEYDYNGVVLPSVFDDRIVGIDTTLLQYICICKTTDSDGTTSYKVYFTHAKPFYKAYSGYYSLAVVAEDLHDGYDAFASATTTGAEWTDAYDNSIWSGQTMSLGGKNYEWVWSNTDIYDESGALIYSASNPTPVSYKTDAVLLPPLPEWDSETYPYAYITYAFSTGKILLWLRTNRFMAYATDGKYTERINESYGYYTYYTYTDGAWVLSKENVEDTGGVSFRSGNTILWSNTDVPCSDGGIYREADAQYCVYLV